MSRLEEIAEEIGVGFVGTSSRPAGDVVELRPVRVGLWDRYGGDMPSGWTRWLFEQMEFPFELVFAPELDAGDLNAKFDVLVFMSSAIPAAESGGGGRGGGGPDPSTIPEEYRDRLGSVSTERTLPRLREFVDDGGTIVAIGNSALNLARHFELPIEDHLTEKNPQGEVRRLGSEKFYVPGSVLRVHVDNTHPAAWGMDETVDIFYRNSPTFRLRPNAAAQGVEPVAWFPADSLRSGWAWGEGYLEDGVAAVSARVGRGNVFLYGPEINFRAQPHGTFKLLFNAIYGGGGSGNRSER